MSDLPVWFEEMEEVTDKIADNKLNPEEAEQILNQFWSKLMNEKQDGDIIFFQKLIELAEEVVGGSVQTKDYHLLAKKLRKEFMDKHTSEGEG